MVSIATFLLTVALLIQLPQVQTFVVGKFVESLDDKLDADISFEKIHLQPFRTLVIKNIEIIDRNPVMDAADPNAPKIDTFFRAEYITAKFSYEGLFKQQGIHLDKVTVSNAQMNLMLEDKEDSGDGDVTTDNLSRIFRLENAEPSEPNPNEIFHIREVSVMNMGFAMKNYGTDKVPYYGGISWDDLDVMNINLDARELRFKDGIMYGIADFLSFREKSGFIAEEMRGKATVGRGKTIVEDLLIDDPWSELHLPFYMMSYENVKAFSDYISKVKMDAVIDDSYLDFKTLTYFAPQLEGNSLKASISGSMSGYVDNFKVQKIKVASEAGGFSGTVNGRLTGLPDIENTRIEAKVSKCVLTSDGLGKFLSEWSKGKEIDLSRYAKGHIFMVEAKADGLMDAMNIHADIYSLIGGMKADMTINGLISENQPISLKGTASSENLDLGKIISNDIIGPVTMRTDLEADLGETPKIKIDSLFVDRLNFNRYDYSRIIASGDLEDNRLQVTIVASDPNLNMLLQGGFALSSKTNNSLYKFYASVTDANLNAMNFDKRGKSRLRFETDVNFTRTGDGNTLGQINVADLIFENRKGVHNIGNIILTSHSNDDVDKIRMKSKFADGSYKGTAPIQKFISDILNITLKKETPALFENPDYTLDGDSYNLDFNTHNCMDLMAFIMPGAYINEGTRLTVNVDSTGIMDASLHSPRLAIGDNYIKDVVLTADNRNDAFSCDITTQEFMFEDFSIANNHMRILADDNHLGASYSFDNHSNKENRGELVMNAGLSREDGMLNLKLDMLPTAVYLNSKEWKIQPSTIRVRGMEISVDSLEITSGNERIYAYGNTAQNREDTLVLGLDRFDISILNPLIGAKFGLKGAASGNVKVTSPMSSRGLLADIIIDSTYFANEALGTVLLGSTWDEADKKFDIILRNELNAKRNIDVEASLTPKKKTLEGDIRLDSLPIKYAEPILTDVFSEMGGFISGEISANGRLDNLKISSRGTRLDNALLKVAFTNVPYYADGSFDINDTGVYFNDISIRDTYDGTGTVSGSINWDRFKDINFDTRLKVNAIEGVNLPKENNEGFYGNIFGTGNVSITGPMNALTLTVDAVTAKTGRLHIPMSSSVTSGGRTNLLRFTEPKKDEYIDPYLAMRSQAAKERNSNSDFFVKLNVEALPNVDVFVEIDESTGNVLSARGRGQIELDISNDVFDINGDYTLTSGQYNFSALGLVNRQFEIQEGSSINFSGDIMASTLNINAIYETKTSLATLLADDKSVANRRIVECGIQITDKLSNPRLAFSIDIPDLNPMVKARVESALSTEDKKQKQFLSLLLSNSFLPDEQSGIVNNTSMLYSNVSEAMANQLSNILHKLDIPLDLGLNYQPTETGTDLFDVAVSTQLFNNRVIVNGNIGNKEYSSGSTQNDVVGDLDIEIKLNRSGALRLNLFSHSADLYSNYLDNTQRNGVGIMYQTEFNNFGRFIKLMFSNKKKRQAARLADEQSAISEEKVELKITKEDYEKTRNKNDKR